jgi:hypothetical protein
LLIAVVCGVGVLVVWRTQVALFAPTWYRVPIEEAWRPTLAGWWLGCVSLPVFQFGQQLRGGEGHAVGPLHPAGRAAARGDQWLPVAPLLLTMISLEELLVRLPGGRLMPHEIPVRRHDNRAFAGAGIPPLVSPRT